MKARLYSTIGEWDECHSIIKLHLGIPNGEGTTEYTERIQVDNGSHADHGKYVFIVKTSGGWKCDDQFDVNDLVNFDSDWFTSGGLE